MIAINYYDEPAFRRKITIYSFICSIAVVFIHTYNCTVYGLSENSTGLGKYVFYFESVANIIWSLAVPFYFMCSGYLFFRTFYWNNLLQKWKTRFFSIVVPFFIWCTLYYFLFVLLAKIPLSKDAMNSVKTFSWNGYFLSLWKEEYYVFWFLKELIVQIIFCPLYYLILKNRWRIETGIIGLVLCYLLAQRLSVSAVNLYFAFGSYIGMNHQKAARINNSLLSYLGFAGVVIYVIFSFLKVPVIKDFFIIKLFSLVCFWYIGNLADYRKELKWWTGISFFIYCTHDILLETYEKVFLIILGKHPIFAIVDYIFMPFVTIASVVLIARIMKKFTPIIWRTLTGSRG